MIINFDDFLNYIQKKENEENEGVKLLKAFLSGLRFSTAEQERWLRAFYTYWLSEVLKEVEQAGASEDKEKIEAVAKNKFKITLDHFISTTINTLKQKKG